MRKKAAACACAIGVAVLCFLAAPFPVRGEGEALVPVLAEVSSNGRLTGKGIVYYFEVNQKENPFSSGLVVSFERRNCRFTPMSQTSVVYGIYRAAEAAGLSTTHWVVTVRCLQSDEWGRTTIDGNSLSAMIALTAVALAKGDAIRSDTVVTGTIEPDRHLGEVGSLVPKIEAAGKDELLHCIIIPDVPYVEETPRTPFLKEVRPISEIEDVYLALTGHELR